MPSQPNIPKIRTIVGQLAWPSPRNWLKARMTNSNGSDRSASTIRMRIVSSQPPK